MNQASKIYIAGHTGLVGSAIYRNLKTKGYSDFIFTPQQDFDLRVQNTVSEFFRKEKPEVVFLAAAKVGGIVANNTYRAEFIYDNLQIQNNIIHESYLNGVKKLVFLGSSCIYPKNCKQPMNEEDLLSSALEYTNEPYAIAKIAGIKLTESYNLQYGTNFIAVMPTNLYGYNDNFDLEKSHVLPALIRKMHLGKALFEGRFEVIRKDLDRRPIEAVNGLSKEVEIRDVLIRYGIDNKAVTLWGSGNPRREFLHADDLADACVYIAEKVDYSAILETQFQISKPAFPLIDREVRNTHINIGTGVDMSIRELSELIKNEIVGYEGELIWDQSKPDGTFQKLLDVSKLHALGWRERISLEEGIRKVYENYIGD
jgi:GDP-L-fucose synthase